MNAFKRICTCRKSCNRIIVSEKEIVGIILKDQLFKSNYQTWPIVCNFLFTARDNKNLFHFVLMVWDTNLYQLQFMQPDTGKN